MIVDYYNLKEKGEMGRSKKRKFWSSTDLDGDGGGVGVIVGNDDVIGQNDDVVLDFLRNALCAGGG